MESGYLTQWGYTRWRKTFWSGMIPRESGLQLGIHGVLWRDPHFDDDHDGLPATVPQKRRLWSSAQKGIFAFDPTNTYSGRVVRFMSRARVAGRILGMPPYWTALYLYTMDSGLAADVFGNADISGQIPIHYRESDSTRLYDGTNSAFGRVVAVTARPGISTNDPGGSVIPGDMPVVVGTVNAGDHWTPDEAHTPALVNIPYLLSGDYYYLEELSFTSAYRIASGNVPWRQSSSGVLVDIFISPATLDGLCET